MAPGSYSSGRVRVRQIDAAGNTSSATTTFLAFTVDTTAPTAPTLRLASDTGFSSTDRLTNNSTITVGGLETGASWQYSTDSGTTWSTALAATTTTSSFSVAPGSYTTGQVQVRQSDGAGNSSPTNTTFAAFTVDSSAPAAPSLTLARDTGDSSTDRLTNNGTITVGALEAGARWQFSTNSGSTWSTALAATTTSFSVAAGNYTPGQVQVRQTDAAGNSSAVNNSFQAFTVDTSAPAPTSDITNITDDVGPLGTLAADALTDDATPTFSGTLSAALAEGETLRIFNGTTLLGSASVTNTTWSFTPAALPNGFYAVTARVADAAGNQGATRAVQRLSLDANANQVIGDANNNILNATNAKDVLTGYGGADRFSFASLTTSNLANFDRITDFAIGTDRLDGPTAVTAANINKLGAVSALDATSIGNMLTSTSFLANGAATFTYADPSGISRSFIALNDGIAGYDTNSDAIVEITRYTGLLANLAVI